MSDNFSKNLVTLLSNEHISRAELARMSRVPRQTIIRIIYDRGKPLLSTRKKICEALNVSLDVMQREIIPEREVKMTTEEIKQEIEDIEQHRFYLAMTDRWDEGDFALDNKLWERKRELEKMLEERGENDEHFRENPED